MAIKFIGVANVSDDLEVDEEFLSEGAFGFERAVAAVQGDACDREFCRCH